MDRDDFIITVYCLVCEHYQALKAQFAIRRGGFAPTLTSIDHQLIQRQRGLKADGGAREQPIEVH